MTGTPADVFDQVASFTYRILDIATGFLNLIVNLVLYDTLFVLSIVLPVCAFIAIAKYWLSNVKVRKVFL